MASPNETYDTQFFSEQVDGSVRSAERMVPAILEMRKGAKSAVDVGCGTGSWLSQYAANGISDYLGIDGFLPSEDMLRIPAENTLRHDLTKPLTLGRRFDVAQSLEVAEHLPSSAAPGFVDLLVSLSDLVVFGAAIPGQGGTEHVNEQWQGYWAALFARRGYVCVDALRPKFWYDPDVEWWYAQNGLVFVNKENEALVKEVQAFAGDSGNVPDLIHPNCFRMYREIVKNRTVGDDDLLLDAIPKRFKSKERNRKLADEPLSWLQVAKRHPTRVSYWWDLYRVQRRRARGG